MRLIRRKKNRKGFSLIELILVLGLSSLMFLGVLNTEKRRTETLRAEAAGQQIEEVGQALGEYIGQMKGNLSARLTQDGSLINVPLSVLQGVPAAGVAVSSGGTVDLPGRRLLPASFNTVNALNTGYLLQIRNEGVDSLRGLVITDNPVVDGTGAVRYDWLGFAARAAGASSGMTFFEGNRVTGLNAGWSIPSASFSAISRPGQLAYRTAYSANYDSTYLRRDGLYAMTGNLNLGNYDIVDVTNITFNGWLSGNNAVLNNLEVGHVESASIYNTGLIEARAIKGITGQNPSFADVDVAAVVDRGDFAQFSRILGNYSVDTNFLNRGKPTERAAVYVGGTGVTAADNNNSRSYIYAADIRLGNNTKNSRPIESWLSDRLPKYVSRGVTVVTVTNTTTGFVPAPNCGGNAADGDAPSTPKIIVTPQEVHSQGAVRGRFDLGAQIDGAGYITLTVNQDLYAVNHFSAYATAVGGGWNVYIATPNYEAARSPSPQGNLVGGKVVAHVYCAYDDER